MEATKSDLQTELVEVREKLKASGHEEFSGKRCTQEQWDLLCRQGTILDKLAAIRENAWKQGLIV